MFVSGYHGTTLDKAHSILKDKQYNVSSKETEWLGDGIYFYFTITDAYEWKKAEGIMHSIIKVNDDEYIDMDTDKGKKIVEDVKKMIKEKYSYEINTDMNDPERTQKNQYKVMKMIWDNNPKIKLLMASFAKEKNQFMTLLDTREKRREFCVRDNSCIKHTYLIERSVLDD